MHRHAQNAHTYIFNKCSDSVVSSRVSPEHMARDPGQRLCSMIIITVTTAEYLLHATGYLTFSH